MRIDRPAKRVKVFDNVVSITKNTELHDLTHSLLEKWFKTHIPSKVFMEVTTGSRHVNISFYFFFYIFFAINHKVRTNKQIKYT